MCLLSVGYFESRHDKLSIVLVSFYIEASENGKLIQTIISSSNRDGRMRARTTSACRLSIDLTAQNTIFIVSCGLPSVIICRLYH
jgi:hypothetical protein